LNKLLQLLLIGSLGLATGAATAAEMKIGFVNVEQILKDAPQTAESGKKLEKEFEKRDQDLQKMAKQLQTMQDNLEKNAVTLSESEHRNREREFNDLNREFQRRQREFREDLNLRQNDETAALFERINRAVKQVAEGEKYDIILQEAVYISPRIDLTDKVIKALNDGKDGSAAK